MTEEETQQSWKEISALNDEIKSAGTWVFGGALHEPDTATVVRVADGQVITTDGPFAESREHLGGFYVIEADLDAALGWASSWKLSGYQPFHASRADLLRRLGREDEAAAAYRRAAELAPTDAEREFLELGGRGAR